MRHLCHSPGPLGYSGMPFSGSPLLSVIDVIEQWQARARRRPSSSEDEENVGLELELILISGLCSSKEAKPNLHLGKHTCRFPIAIPEFCLEAWQRACLCAVSLRAFLTSESAQLTPCLTLGWLSWQVSPEQSPLTQILACMVTWAWRVLFCRGLSSVSTLCCS